jgi:hypothetical protein
MLKYNVVVPCAPFCTTVWKLVPTPPVSLILIRDARCTGKVEGSFINKESAHLVPSQIAICALQVGEKSVYNYVSLKLCFVCNHRVVL